MSREHGDQTTNTRDMKMAKKLSASDVVYRRVKASGIVVWQNVRVWRKIADGALGQRSKVSVVVNGLL